MRKELFFDLQTTAQKSKSKLTVPQAHTHFRTSV